MCKLNLKNKNKSSISTPKPVPLTNTVQSLRDDKTPT